MNWERVPFEDIYAIPSRNGLSRPQKIRGEGYKMINMGELFKFDRIGDIEMELVPMNDRELDNMCVQEEDLLFARQSLVLAGAGKVSIVQKVSEKTTFESHLIRIRLNREKAEPYFYFYFFKSPYSGMSSIVQQCAQAGIRGSDLKKLLVPLPPIETQKKMSSVLYTYDDLIENNRRRIQLLEESARLLYREWFAHLRFPGHEHVKINGGVPEGWEKKRLVDSANLVMGQSPKSEYYNEEGEGLPFHQGVTNFGDRFVNHKIYCTVKTRLANQADILCSVRAPVGRLNITLDQIVVGRGLSAIRSKSGYQSFLYYQLKNHFFKENMIGSGAIFAAVTKKDMENQELLCPTEDLIKDFEETSIPIDKQIKILNIQNNKLREARDLLLPRLMNGEITV